MKELSIDSSFVLLNKLTTVNHFPTGKHHHSIGDVNVKYILKLDVKEYTNFFKGLTTKEVSSIEFLNCSFQTRLFLHVGVNQSFFQNTNFTFALCDFMTVAFGDFTYNGKIKFKLCKFNLKKYVNNAVFKNYVEYFDCEFADIVIFNKVEFERTVVFTKSTFYKNVLFTYSRFFGVGIFSRVKFKEGLDLSQAIIDANLIFFETKIKNYHSEGIDINEKKKFKNANERNVFDISITGSGKIPTLNKRETYRIIKQQLLKEGNNIDALKYESLEKQSFQQQLIEHKIKRTDGDRLIFTLNNCSNKHKSSWKRGVKFTIICAFLSYFLAIILSGQFYFSFEDLFPTLWKHIKGVIYFLNPTHNPNFIGELFNLDKSKIWVGYYFFDYLGRIAVGYGIYQTIQAFRKFR